MKNLDIMQTPKDAADRLHLSESELLSHPPGLLELPDNHLQAVTGGAPFIPIPPARPLGGHAALLLSPA